MALARPPRASAPAAIPSEARTELDGIRGKVFVDRYSLKDREGQPTELHPEQMWWRVAQGIAAVERTAEKRKLWAKRFYETLSGFKFVPGGRILAGAGTGHAVTYYNCFEGETPVHTREGIVPIGSLRGEHEVLSEGRVFRPAFFRSFGYQRLWRVTLANGTVLHATADHQWVVSEAKGGTTRVTTTALQGRRIPLNPRPAPPRDEEFAAGVRHGIVFGDGTVQYGRSHVCLFGESEALAQWFAATGARRVDGSTAVKTHVRVQALPAAWKRELPGSDASPSYWRGFIAGLIAADGHVDKRGSVALYNKDADLLARIAEGMAVAGLVASGISLTREASPFDGTDKPLYRLQFFKSTIEPADLLLTSHREHFAASPGPRQSTIQVVDVKETDRVEEVFCCVEPETHTITVGHGYLTGQCYVIPSPEDSRSGILDNLKVMTEIMARGGGVGINLSSLRPRGSYIRTVNGTASGPCSWAELYSVATGDVIQQGGSRRGALMLMLNDDHPDVEEFITVKQDLRRINHANLSVCVSDAFMEAVERDADWDLKWNGEVRKTIKARHLWDLICQAAWRSAEPGLVFMDRYNKESNTWYYEDIRCVNPCGEQGLPPWGVCNLGALNLAAFVENGVMDYAGLAEHARVAMRFLDNVIDANLYFIKENEAAQLGTRRTGLGTMGLGDALIKLRLRYGSEESIAAIEAIYATIRDAAYDMSADVAVEKGAFPFFDRDKYMQGRFIKRLPPQVQEKIARGGIRNAVLLTQAPTGTTSLLSGVSSGIEPVYDFAMRRRDRTGEHLLYHPLYKEWRDRFVQEHEREPERHERPDYFVSANDLTPEDHVQVQAVIQRSTDSSISKTVNAPNAHTVDDVKRLYGQAYHLGCKGITYFRDGSREGVLEHIAETTPGATDHAAPALPMTPDRSKSRPELLRGYTRQVQAPEGKVNLTLNSDDAGLYEVFVSVGRSGSDLMAMAEAVGRLLSYALQIPSTMTPEERGREIARQLRGIGGSRSVGFGPEQVRSLPDAIALALLKHLEAEPGAIMSRDGEQQLRLPIVRNDAGAAEAIRANLCPSCGQIALVYEEGCKKCYSCGHSEC